MNSTLAIVPADAFLVRAADRLESTGLLTRVLLFTTATLAGAVLYLGANWPGSQPPIIVTIAALPPVAAAPPPVQPAPAQHSTAIDAGPLVAEAIRAASAASKTSIEASASTPAAVPVAAVAAQPATVSRSAGSSNPSPPSAASAPRPLASVSTATNGLDASVQPRAQSQPLQSANRITVPAALPPPSLPSSSSASPAPQVSGANRILVPAAPPNP
jgi:hypothetical protein